MTCILRDYPDCRSYREDVSVSSSPQGQIDLKPRRETISVSELAIYINEDLFRTKLIGAYVATCVIIKVPIKGTWYTIDINT
jgi:hypothetical protein